MEMIKMVSNELEYFTAQEALDAGLFEALKRGETKICGHYEYDKSGSIEFKQQNFVFKDKNNDLRIGKFKNADDVLEFMVLVKGE